MLRFDNPKVIWLFFIFLAFSSVTVMSQDIGNIDFSSIRVDELSDAQIRQIWERAREENMSIEQVQALALSRGMPRTEVNKLRSRLNQARLTGEARPVDALSDTPRADQRVTNQLTEEPFVQSVRQDIVFGANLFNQRSISFQPSMNIPTPDDYVLGSGDELIIDIWGAAETNYRLTVTPEGYIRIQSLGPIFVNGLSIEVAREKILSRLQEIYSGLNPNRPEQANTFAQVSLGNVRSINVTVLGEATQPGTYTITSLSTVFNALHAAGGPDKNGSFRSIKLIRNQETVTELDIYDFLVYGDLSSNIMLKDQDIIKIDPYLNRVTAEGELKRTGIFEMKPGETLENLVEFAGGFTDKAYTKRLVLERNTPVQQSIIDVMYPEGKELEIKNGDRFSVGRILDRYENRVQIEGAVFREGTYELTPGLTLSDLIKKADGLREDAFLSRGIIFRLQDDLSMETIPFHAGEVVSEPGKNDIVLKRDDLVRISSIFDLKEDFTINVRGAVNSAGEFDYAEGMTIEDAIFIAQGFRDEAAPYRIDVARRITNQEGRLKTNQIADIFQFEVDRNLVFTNGTGDFKLQPFDQVFVRTEPNYEQQQIVRIEGEVQFPGEYALENRTTRVSDLLELAGGLSQYAFPEGASLERRITVDEADIEEIESLDTLVVESRVMRQTTKVGLQLDEVIEAPKSKFDLILRDGDVLRVPKELQTVRVEGEVLSPVSIRYEEGKSLSRYIDEAGGVTDNGKGKKAFIVYANGEVDRMKKFLFFKNNPEVRPGATIIVPQKPVSETLSAQERIGILSAIVSMLAIVSTTIVQIN